MINTMSPHARGRRQERDPQTALHPELGRDEVYCPLLQIIYSPEHLDVLSFDTTGPSYPCHGLFIIH